ncbi:MAG: hypothetical protein WKF57_05965 [Nakamurella sp.]
MRDPISGQDIGRTIACGNPDRTPAPALMPWPDDVYLQGGGRGLVFRRNPAEGEAGSYTTAFVEAFVVGSFLRGEGPTIADAEKSCWDSYQRLLHCPGPTGEHSWKPGRTLRSGFDPYRNGAGFCEHCNAFRSGLFTAEELGQFCQTCGEPTMWHYERDADGVDRFLCETHTPRDPRLDDLADGELDESALHEVLTALAAPSRRDTESTSTHRPEETP